MPRKKRAPVFFDDSRIHLRKSELAGIPCPAALSEQRLAMFRWRADRGRPVDVAQPDEPAIFPACPLHLPISRQEERERDVRQQELRRRLLAVRLLDGPMTHTRLRHWLRIAGRTVSQLVDHPWFIPGTNLSPLTLTDEGREAALRLAREQQEAAA